ncbi:HAMP domain-containing sensor histidine kinase [Tunturiibacter empetritectus]|uniref:histidine kinase n=1 Tax=Tunturiibacter lichenicola TaxID=2051959 RepID=A0A852VE68_9BACT|nr:HAMP domain-containing sensor histidine kinase [Edaphobacter lichenicola]NYF91168.1 signal transduction histidine kinase [Edaphobacter lichenicola]
MSGLIVVRWVELSLAGGGLWALWCRMQARVAEGRRERREQEELRAYAGLDVRLGADAEMPELAVRVSRLMAEKSVFRRTAVLVRDAAGVLAVAANAGMEETTVGSLNAWAEGVVEAERRGGIGTRRGEGGLGRRVKNNAFAVVFEGGRGQSARLGEEARGAIVVPLWTTSGRMMGALAVGADGLLSVRQRELEEVLWPLEALGVKVARAMENVALAEKLMRAERLAGVGMLAGGMAHALSNPLTAVLGFAELIAGSTGEARVKEDAEIIVREALRMRQTVETLLEFWKPVGQGNELVDLMELVRELAAACGEKLEGRGIRLVVQADGEVPEVRGNRHRLRQLLEHLLNNAAQALAGVRGVKPEEEMVIRMSLNCSGNSSGGYSGSGSGSFSGVSSGEVSEEASGLDGRRVHLIVSDTGPGFREPGRIFDPINTMQEAGDGAGMGLSLCYSIVQEHGGEISAFNMHPHGAGVAVELPVRMGKKSVVAEETIRRAAVGG